MFFNDQSGAKKQTVAVLGGKFSVNDSQLNHLKKQMLANSYQKQMREQQNRDLVLSRRKSTSSTPITSNQNPQVSRITTLIKQKMVHINQMERDQEKQMKAQLANEYYRQMKRKQYERKLQKEIKERQDKAMIESLKRMSQIQNQKMKKIYESNKKNMDEYLRITEEQRLQKIEEKRKDQQMFNKRYGVMPKSNSLGSLNQSPKLIKFRKHYQNVNQFQKQVQNNYLSKWSPLIQKKEQQRQKLVQLGTKKNAEEVNEKQLTRFQNETRLIQDMKETLMNQIREKERNKMKKQKQQKHLWDASIHYEGVYHPICNPVDLKINHDNKYIIRQLKQEQEKMDRMTGSTGSELTGLARKGSYVLLSK